MATQDVIQITEAKREDAKIVIFLAGETGEGKTYTALQIAKGLAGGDPRKIGLLDTENRRGSLYSDIFEKPFLIGDFQPPFSPDRYIKAMRQFAEMDIEVLVIDSGSHEHEGMGGLEEIANAPKANGDERKIADWLTAKREHRKFMNCLLNLPCHVIMCLRAREKTSFKDPKKPVSLGLQPICEKNVMFEATASFMMGNKGLEHDPIKLPECLKKFFPEKGYFTPKVGEDLRKWLGTVDPMERAKNILRLASGNGMEALKEAWTTKLSKAERTALEDFKATLKEGAMAADKEAAQQAEEFSGNAVQPTRKATPKGAVEVVAPKIWSDLLPNSAWQNVRIPKGLQGENELLREVIIDPELFDALRDTVMRDNPETDLLRMALDCAIYTRVIERRATAKNIDVATLDRMLLETGAINEGESILTIDGEAMITISDSILDIIQ